MSRNKVLCVSKMYTWQHRHKHALVRAPVWTGSSLHLVFKRSTRLLFQTTSILKSWSVPKDSFHSLHFILLSEPGAQQLHIKVPPVGGEGSVSLLICPVPVCDGHWGIPETGHGATLALTLHKGTQSLGPALQSYPLMQAPPGSSTSFI